jgi:3-oxoadipate enol-lactonase
MSDTTSRAGAWDQPATRVLINPIGNTAECWQFANPSGTPFEYPGHGQRERQPGWTHEKFAQEIVDHFDGPLDIVGMSMGGTIVANLLVRHPERIRSAVILCSGSIASAGETPESRAKRVANYEWRGNVVMGEEGMPAVIPDTMSRWFSPYALRVDLPGVRYARETLEKTDPGAWYDIWNCQATSELLPLDALRAITQPVTIVGGMHDQAAGLRGLLAVHQLIPNSRYEIVPGSHMMHLEQPELLRAALDRHEIWAPIGNRVEEPIGSCVWLDQSDDIARSAA